MQPKKFHTAIWQRVYVWPGGIVVTALNLRLQRSRVRLAASHFQVATLGKLFTRVPLSPGSITHPFNGPLSRTTQVSRYQKGKTNLDFTEARDSEWQWHQLGHMQVCTSLQTDNHTSTPPLCLQAGCPSCHPTNSVKALKAGPNQYNLIPIKRWWCPAAGKVRSGITDFSVSTYRLMA